VCDEQDEKFRVIGSHLLTATEFSDFLVLSSCVLFELIYGKNRNKCKEMLVQKVGVEASGEFYLKHYTQALQDGVARPLLHICICFGVLLLLNNQAKEAITVFETTQKAFVKAGESVCLELLEGAYFQILESLDFEKRILAAIAEQGSTLFPRNKILLNGLRFGKGTDWLESHFDALVAEETCSPSVYLAAVKLVKGRDARVKFFEKAFANSRVRHSVRIWVEYIQLFKDSSKSYEFERVLFRAIKTVPWSVELWLLFLKHMPTTTEEKREIVSLMLRKGLRLQCPAE
jgi:hypothetical protein